MELEMVSAQIIGKMFEAITEIDYYSAFGTFYRGQITRGQQFVILSTRIHQIRIEGSFVLAIYIQNCSSENPYQNTKGFAPIEDLLKSLDSVEKQFLASLRDMN